MDRYPDSTDAPSFSWRGPKLVALTVLLPLAFALMGCWEQGRSVELLEQQTKIRILVEQAAQRLEQLSTRDPRASVRSNQGRLVSATYAHQMAQQRLGELETEEQVAAIRAYLPPVAMWAGGLAALLGATGLLAAATASATRRTPSPGPPCPRAATRCGISSRSHAWRTCCCIPAHRSITTGSSGTIPISAWCTGPAATRSTTSRT
jgi:hypothetical protein